MPTPTITTTGNFSSNTLSLHFSPPPHLVYSGRCQPPQPKDSSPNCLPSAKSVRTKHVPNMFSLLALLRLTAPATFVRLLHSCYVLAFGQPMLSHCHPIDAVGNPAPTTSIATPPGVHKFGSRKFLDHLTLRGERTTEELCTVVFFSEIIVVCRSAKKQPHTNLVARSYEARKFAPNFRLPAPTKCVKIGRAHR
jgi:hypothetical protein